MKNTTKFKIAMHIDDNIYIEHTHIKEKSDL